MSEPIKSLDALTNPNPLTLGKIALLERIKSPLLAGRIDSMTDAIRAVWAVKTPTAEAARKLGDIDALSLEMADGMTTDELNAEAVRVLEGIVKFYEMLPRGETGEDAKKKE